MALLFLPCGGTVSLSERKKKQFCAIKSIWKIATAVALIRIAANRAGKQMRSLFGHWAEQIALRWYAVPSVSVLCVWPRSFSSVWSLQCDARARVQRKPDTQTDHFGFSLSWKEQERGTDGFICYRKMSVASAVCAAGGTERNDK